LPARRAVNLAKNHLFNTRADSSERNKAEHLDDWMVKQASDGDTHAFSHIVRLYKNRIAALGMSFLKNITDTEDFVQDVFIKIFNNLKMFRGEARFSTWITRIAYNMAINTVTRRKEFSSLVNEELVTDSAAGPEEENIMRVTKEALRDAIKELPELYTVCLDLYFFHDFSYKEISVITDFPINTIKSHIFRAKKLLRDKLMERIGV
jgi:RNA polymerase sigma-70 factor (ECF subfamily)